MTSSKPLVLKDFFKSYGSTPAVSNVSLELKNGEVFGFLGPNGAGKSTTIRAILNFIQPTSGSIEIFGRDSVRQSLESKPHIGYLAGDIALYERMTGRELINYLSHLGKETDWKYVDRLAADLQAQLDKQIHSLSKGNKQKIGLIQAFMHRPELIVLDEPTSGLDPLMKQVFYDMVKEMKNDGKTIFVSSHDLTEVQKICDRAAFIRDGKIVATEEISGSTAINLRRYIVAFDKKPPKTIFKNIKSVTDVRIDNKRAIVTVNGSVSNFIKELAQHKPIDLDERDISLDEMFMHYYQSGGKNE